MHFVIFMCSDLILTIMNGLTVLQTFCSLRNVIWWKILSDSCDKTNKIMRDVRDAVTMATQGWQHLTLLGLTDNLPLLLTVTTTMKGESSSIRMKNWSIVAKSKLQAKANDDPWGNQRYQCLLTTQWYHQKELTSSNVGLPERQRCHDISHSRSNFLQKANA